MRDANKPDKTRLMRHRWPLALLAVIVVVPAAGLAYEITWHTFEGGGMASASGGTYELSGTAGQPDASTTVHAGGAYELQGGYWVESAALPCCAGDSNCDDVINWRDIDFFVAAMNDNVTAWEAMFAPGDATCPYINNDVNDDGTVNWRDIDPLVAVMNTACP